MTVPIRLLCVALPLCSFLAAAAEPGDYNAPAEMAPVGADGMPVPPPCLSAEAFQRRLQDPGLPPLVVLTAPASVPLWRTDTVPLALADQLTPRQPVLALAARPGTFLAFQLGLVSRGSSLKSFAVDFGRLTGPGKPVPAAAFRCISLGGIGADGRPFTKTLPIRAGAVQPVWIGVDIPPDSVGHYQGRLRVVPSAGSPVVVALSIDVGGEPVADHGAIDDDQLARLRWLDSTIGEEPVLPRGFKPVSVAGRRISILGRTLVLGPDGLPAQVMSRFSGSNTSTDAAPQPLLASPVQFVAEVAGHPLVWRPQPLAPPRRDSDCEASWPLGALAADLRLSGTGHLGFDGQARFQVQVSADRDLEVSDLRLEIPYSSAAARYFMGLGHKGGVRPSSVSWSWDVEHRNEDGFWMGEANLGAAWEFHDEHYRRPLVNIYYSFRPLVLPDSWGNQGRGGISIAPDQSGAVRVRVFSGPRKLRRGSALDFDFEANFTPSKPVDTDAKWRDRIVHPNGRDVWNMEAALKALPQSTATLINVHHAKDENPFINYPYGAASLPLLRSLTERAHAQGARVKIYYTTRELTIHLPELWAINSLGGEIITPGPGANVRIVTNKNGADPWLAAHLGPSFIPAWRTTLGGRFAGMHDLAVITTPDSRWNNFYLAGLDFLCRYASIDGVYIDDTALDRNALLRARRILERDRPSPHIDLHSWNPLKPMGSFANSALLYAPLMPYLDRLWLGEGFNYDEPPDYWLVEIAGIPYGVMSEMLQGGGQPWRGMVFGMTARLGGPHGDPRPLWHYWDQAGFAGSQMIGWWDPACPVRTGRDDVLATVYRHPHSAVVALASWAKTDVPVNLQIDWKALGIEPSRARAVIRAIDGFQEAGTPDVRQPIAVPAGKGFLIEVSE